MMGSTGTHLNPTVGMHPSNTAPIPCVGLGYRQTGAMRPKKPRTEEPEAEDGPRARDILAANLKTLLAASKISARPNELTRLKHITEKSNGVLSNGKLDRIRR